MDKEPEVVVIELSHETCKTLAENFWHEFSLMLRSLNSEGLGFKVDISTQDGTQLNVNLTNEPE